MDDLILVAKQVRKKPRPKPGRQLAVLEGELQPDHLSL
jgi:hypothetical protein